MLSIRWQGREIGPDLLIASARQARRHAWLDAEDRRFLHRAALSLAAQRPLGGPELLRLDLLLSALRRLGWRAEEGHVAEPAMRGATVDDDAELAALQAEIGRLGLLLAAAHERLEACQQRLDRRLQGLPPDDDLPWQMNAWG